MKATKRFLACILAMSLLVGNMSTVAYAVDEVPAAPEAVEPAFEAGPSAEELAAQAAAEQAAAEEAARVAAEQAAAEEAARVAAEQAAAEEAARAAAEKAAAEKAAAEKAAAEKAAAEKAAAEKAAAEKAAAEKAAAEKAAAEAPAVVEEQAAAPKAAMAAANAGDIPGIEEPVSDPDVDAEPDEALADETEETGDETEKAEDGTAAPDAAPAVEPMQLTAAGVTVSAELPADTQLAVAAGNAAAAAAAIGGDAQVLQVWDITLTDANGNTVEPDPNAGAAVTVPAPEQDAEVYYIHSGAADKVADLPAGQSTFTVSHFSTYAIAALPEETEDEDEAGIDTGLLPDLGEPIAEVPEEEAVTEEEAEEDNGIATTALDDYGIMPIASADYPVGIETTNKLEGRGFTGSGYLFVDGSFTLIGRGKAEQNHTWSETSGGSVVSLTPIKDGGYTSSATVKAVNEGQTTINHKAHGDWNIFKEDESCTITVFEKRTVNYAVDGQGTVSPTAETYAYNTSVPNIPANWTSDMAKKGVKAVPTVAVATPADGYRFDHWELNNEDKGKNLTADMIRAAGNGATFTAVFEEIKKDATITITPNGGEYDGTRHDAAITVTDASDGHELASTEYEVSYSDDPVNAGNYTVTVTGLGAYSENTKTVNFTITQAPLTVEYTLTGGANGKTYDGEPLTLTGAVTGFKGSDDGSVQFGGQASVSLTNAGTVTATPSIVYNTGTRAENYTVSGLDAQTLTITPKFATVKVESRSITYGAPLPKAEELVQVSTELVGDDELTYTAEYTSNGVSAVDPAVDPKDVGTYSVRVTAGDNPNYKLVILGGKLTITPATLTVTTDSAAKNYDGTPLTAPSGTLTGLKNSDTARLVVEGFQVGVGQNTNTYRIDWSDPSKAKNYTIVENLGTLRVFAPDETPAAPTNAAEPPAPTEPAAPAAAADVPAAPAPAAPTAPAAIAGGAGLLTPAAPAAVIDDDATPLAPAPEEDEGEAVEIAEDETPLAPAPQDEAGVTIEEDETPLAGGIDPADAAADCREFPHMLWALLLLAAAAGGAYANKRRQAGKFSRG